MSSSLHRHTIGSNAACLHCMRSSQQGDAGNNFLGVSPHPGNFTFPEGSQADPPCLPLFPGSHMECRDPYGLIEGSLKSDESGIGSSNTILLSDELPSQVSLDEKIDRSSARLDLLSAEISIPVDNIDTMFMHFPQDIQRIQQVYSNVDGFQVGSIMDGFQHQHIRRFSLDPDCFPSIAATAEVLDPTKGMGSKLLTSTKIGEMAQLLRTLHDHPEWDSKELQVSAKKAWELRHDWRLDRETGCVLKRRAVGTNKAVKTTVIHRREESNNGGNHGGRPVVSPYGSRKLTSNYCYLLPVEHAHAVLLWGHVVADLEVKHAADLGEPTHAGRDRTFENIKKYFSPEGLSKERVNEWIGKCPECSKARAKKRKCPSGEG